MVFCLSSDIAQRWKRNSCVRSSSIRSEVPDLGGHQADRQKKLWEDLFSNPSGWWDNSLDKRGTGQPDFRHKLTREPLWLNSQHKPVWLNSGLAILGAQVPSSFGGQINSCVGSFRPADGIQTLSKEGQLERALDLLLRMDEEGIIPPVNVYSSLLKTCAKQKALAQTKRLYAHLSKHGLETTRFLGEFMVSTLVKCGGLEDALQLFDRLPTRTVFSWTAIISGYTVSGQHGKALEMYCCMREEGLEPVKFTFVSLFRACGSLPNLKEGKRIHAEAVKYRCESDLFVANSLIDMYGKCGSVVDAQNVFTGLSQRDVVSWTAMVGAYVQQGQAEEALELYENMQLEGISVNDRTFVIVFQACGILAEREDVVLVGQSSKPRSLERGKAIHGNARRKGYDADVFVANALITMYGKCGSIVDARYVFERFTKRGLATWNVMLAAYVEQSQGEKALQLYREMQECRVSPDSRTFVSALQACAMVAEKEADVPDGQPTNKALENARAIHADAQQKGFDSIVFVGNALISLYGKCGSIFDAQKIFDGLQQRDVVSWNTMLMTYAQQGQAEKALQLYEQMQLEGMSPDDRSFVGVLLACGMLADKEEDVMADGRLTKLKSLEKGKSIHADAERKGYHLNVFVGSTLISMYGKCGSLVDARKVFEKLSKRNVVSWNAMMAAYAHQGQADVVLQLYAQMPEVVEPNERTFVSSLQACGILAEMQEDVVVNWRPGKINEALESGRVIHADIRSKGYGSDVFVCNALISMYGKCRSLADAKEVFDRLPNRDVVSWNAMLSAYAEQNQVDEALRLYKEMQVQGVRADDITILCILQASSNGGSLDSCRQVHRTLLAAGHELSPLLANSLIHCYGRCASMVDARMLFDTLPQPNVVSWTALLAGYARQGNTVVTLECYEEMLRSGTKPDSVTFLALLSACSHAGLVDKGVEYFEAMSRDHGLHPEIEHYVSMADLLGRAGHFSRIEQMLSSMPMQPDLSFFLCLLSACRMHGKLVLGKLAFHCAVHLQPKHPAAYILLSSIYADAGLWDHANEVIKLRQTAGAWKDPGQSWVKHEQEVHSFVVGDRKHPGQEQLYDILGYVTCDLKEGWHTSLLVAVKERAEKVTQVAQPSPTQTATACTSREYAALSCST